MPTRLRWVASSLPLTPHSDHCSLTLPGIAERRRGTSPHPVDRQQIRRHPQTPHTARRMSAETKNQSNTKMRVLTRYTSPGRARRLAKPTFPPKAASTVPRAASPYHDLPPATHKELAVKLEEMEKTDDGQFRLVFDAIRQLMTPPAFSFLRRSMFGVRLVRRSLLDRHSLDEGGGGDGCSMFASH